MSDNRFKRDWDRLGRPFYDAFGKPWLTKSWIKFLKTDSKWVAFYPNIFIFKCPYDHHVNKVVLWSSTCGFNIGRDCLKPNGLRVPTLLVKILKLDTVKPHNLKACMKNDILTSNLDTFNRMVYGWRFVSRFFNNRSKLASIK